MKERRDAPGLGAGANTKRYAPRWILQNNYTTPRLPPFGKQLAERLLRGNHPFLVRVLVYGPPNYPHQRAPNPWVRAKAINRCDNSAALILPEGEPPTRYTWPVRGLICVVEHWPSRGMDRIVSALAICLLESGADHVVVQDVRFNCTRRVF